MIQYRNSKIYNINDVGLYAQLNKLTETIGDSYPAHFTWLTNKFLKGLQETDTRAYSLAIDSSKFIDFSCDGSFNTTHVYPLSGCSLLKNTPEEKKLCCLFVSPAYRKLGIASKLIENSFELLNTTKPLMTVSEQNLGQLQKLIDRYGFELTSVKESVYKRGVKEYYYNEGLAK